MSNEVQNKIISMINKNEAAVVLNVFTQKTNDEETSVADVILEAMQNALASAGITARVNASQLISAEDFEGRVIVDVSFEQIETAEVQEDADENPHTDSPNE